jgi:hypothetical protein
MVASAIDMNIKQITRNNASFTSMNEDQLMKLGLEWAGYSSTSPSTNGARFKC